MARRPLEVADVVREHEKAFIAHRGGRISTAERRVLDDIATCRTAALGGHIEQCTACGHARIAYNSCRNRHCPKCQASAREKWLKQRQDELLPVGYFHVVFTLPRELGPFALQNRRQIYGLLLRASAEALQELATDPKHLGAQIGFVSILHTWGQRLDHHPHVHCLVAGGGISTDGTRWVACHRGFFLPVRALGRLFRGKFLDHLLRAFEHGELVLRRSLESLNDPLAFRSVLAALYDKEWVVYAKPPFGGPAQVLRYLARYTHRVAISNSRLVEMTDRKVRFRWKDYRHGGRHGVMTLAGVEFLRRFLLHLLPDGFMRIRHYGFLANRSRANKLQHCRKLIDAVEQSSEAATTIVAADDGGPRCPECKRGQMRCVLVFKSWDPTIFARVVPLLDSS